MFFLLPADVGLTHCLHGDRPLLGCTDGAVEAGSLHSAAGVSEHAAVISGAARQPANTVREGEMGVSGGGVQLVAWRLSPGNSKQ